MRPHILRVAIIVLISVALGSPASAAVPNGSASSDRQAIVTLEKQWIDAKDASTLDRVLAEDFVHPVYTGDIINKVQNIDWLSTHPRPANHHARFARLEVRLFGNVGQAYGVVSVNDESGKEVSRSVFTDVFVYRDSRRQAVSAQETVVVAGPNNPSS